MTRLFLCRLFIFLHLLAVGCATTLSIPEAEESDLINTAESGFHINVREGTVRYTIQLEQNLPFSHPLYLNVRYENPADKNDPHIEQLVWPPKMEKLSLLSPPLENLTEKVFYKIEIEVFEDRAREKTVDIHQIFIYSTINTRKYGR